MPEDAAWLAIILVAGLFCVTRGVIDLVHRKFVWGVIGLAIGCAIFALPIQSHAVKVDLPPMRR